MRVLLVCDYADWILGTIAARLKSLLSNHMHVTVLVANSERFPALFAWLQPAHDVVHLLSLPLLYKLHRALHRPCVVTLWHVDDWEWPRLKASIDRCDALFVGSQQWHDWIEGYVPDALPMQRMGYGLDVETFRYVAGARDAFLQQHGLPAETLVFGFAGNVQGPHKSRRKGLDHFWECLLRWQRTTQMPFVVSVIGKGWDSDAVPPELRPLIYHGAFIDQEDLPSFYSSLDYYICTSRMEGVPYPVLEAMSCERVVLSTEVGIVPELVADGVNGFLLGADGQAEDFVRVLHHTAHDSAARAACGRAARTTVLHQRAWDVAVEPAAYDAFYRRAIQAYAQRPARQRAAYFYHAFLQPMARKAYAAVWQPRSR